MNTLQNGARRVRSHVLEVGGAAAHAGNSYRCGCRIYIRGFNAQVVQDMSFALTAFIRVTTAIADNERSAIQRAGFRCAAFGLFFANPLRSFARATRDSRCCSSISTHAAAFLSFN